MNLIITDKRGRERELAKEPSKERYIIVPCLGSHQLIGTVDKKYFKSAHEGYEGYKEEYAPLALVREDAA